VPGISTPSKTCWRVLYLLTFAMGISFVDRGTLSIALVSIKRELHLDESQLGVLASAFFMTYTVMQLVAGKLLARMNAITLYAGAFLVWSCATAFTGFTHDIHVFGVSISSFYVLFGLRLLLGCGESISYPATAVLITGLFPEGLRGTANSLIDAGSKIGPALGIMLGTTVLLAVGWRGMFLWLGALSLVWLPIWLMSTRSLDVVAAPSAFSRSLAYRQIASKGSFWGATVGHIGGNYAWSLFVVWLPYFVEHSGFSGKQLVWMSSMPFWLLTVASVGSGYVSDRLIRSGSLPIRVRKATVCIGSIGCAACLLSAALVHSVVPKLLLVLGASLCLGLFSSNNWALAQTLSGEDAAAKWTSLQNLFANASATLAAWITGVVLSRTASFSAAFFIASTVLLIGAAAYWFGIDDRGPVIWERESEGKVSDACLRDTRPARLES